MTRNHLILLTAFFLAVISPSLASAQDEPEGGDTGGEAVAVTTATAGAGVTSAGHLHLAGGLGLTLPGHNFFDDDVGMPFHVTGEYFVIDNLPIGLRLKIDPVFVDPGSAVLVSFQAKAGYNFLEALQAYMVLGLTYMKYELDVDLGMLGSESFSVDDTNFSLGFGAAYTYYFMESLGVEFGFELDLVIFDEDMGDSGDKVMLYEMILIGVRYALGPF